MELRTSTPPARAGRVSSTTAETQGPMPAQAASPASNAIWGRGVENGLAAARPGRDRVLHGGNTSRNGRESSEARQWVNWPFEALKFVIPAEAGIQASPSPRH